MIKIQQRKLNFILVLCLIFVGSTIYLTTALPLKVNQIESIQNHSQVEYFDISTISNLDQIDLTDQLFNNQTFTNRIFSFLQSSQDLHSLDIPSMDTAYYIGVSLKTLESYELVPSIYIDDLELIYLDLFEFVEATFNQNGGYSNWKGARSSMESTFQALKLYEIFGKISELPLSRVQLILNFLDDLKTNQAGYFPLLDWDVPDISSTYRSLWIKNILSQSFPSLTYTNDSDVYDYLTGNFIPPFFLSGASGYSEITNGNSELLASFYAIQSFSLLNKSSPHAENVAKLLTNLITLNGGVSGLLGGLPTTGFTSTAVGLYIELKKYGSLNLDLIVNSTFLDNAVSYLKGNKKVLSGFTSSERDTTPELSSTFFVLQMINNLNQYSPNSYIYDLSGIYGFILQGNQPNFGFGDYPGDKGELSYTTMSILISQILGNDTWLNSNVDRFVLDTFNPTDSGFGFRPFTSSRVKYTYYGIKALRSLSFPVGEARSISNFLLDSVTADGGFGQFADALLSYISHTYWGLTSLNLLGDLNSKNIDSIKTLEWLSYLQSSNGTYSNSRTSDPSIISTYRALQIKTLLGSSETHPKINEALGQYSFESGGYRNTLDKSVPTMEATYYGILLALKLNISIDISKTIDFILSLQNTDGGFGLRPGFSSRVTSTYFAIIALKILDQNISNQIILAEDSGILDVYSPIIISSFVPSIDTNKTIQSSYKTTAKIVDAENPEINSWAQVSFYPENQIIPQRMNFTGIKLEEDSDLRTFILGPFEEAGFLEFQIYAIDKMNNTSVTEIYSVLISIADPSILDQQTNLIASLMISLSYTLLALVGIESIILIRKNKKYTSGEIKMSFQNANKTNEYKESMNLILIMLLITLMSFLARLLMGDALLIIENSIFLFRFLLAIIVILLAKYMLGLQSYGLFAPSVLVVAFLSLGAFWGLVIFLNIFILLFTVRSLLGVFNLPVGFRIGILMVFTITFLGVLELVGEIFRIPFLSNTVFIPIIITPWIADRYVSDTQTNDYHIAAKKLFFTLVISLGAFLLMSNDRIVTFVAVNPESWILLVGLLIYFGRYRNYTRLDMKRFKRLFDKGDKPLSLLIRNREYVSQYNSKVLFPIINKFNMKEQFDLWRVPTPDLLGILSNESEIDAFINNINSDPDYANGFVIKPSQSFGGLGIVVVNKREETDKFVIGGEIYHSNAIKEECTKILQGEYLTSQTASDRDIILIEQKIVCETSLAKISIGLPDIRIIIFRGVPVMIMARLPTKLSGGKANLKQGAIGAAISIASGEITQAEWKSNKITIHPDTNNQIIGYKFENWLEILSIACLAQKASGLGFAGVDLILDENGKALILEVNKRPGLEIQNINLKSLLGRMKYLEDHEIDLTDKSPIHSARKGIELSETLWEVN